MKIIELQIIWEAQIRVKRRRLFSQSTIINHVVGLDDLYSLTDDTSFYPVDVYQTRGKRLALRAVALVLLVLLVQWPLVNEKFLWPDELTLPHDVAIHTVEGLRSIWSSPQHWAKAPLAKTFLYLEYNFASEATIFRAVSLLLHAANAVLLWFLLRRLQIPGAWLAAAIFAVHPVEVQTIALIQQQERLWAAIFFLASISLFLNSAGVPPPAEDVGLAKLGADDPDQSRWPGRIFYTGAILLYIAAILCQPTMLALSPLFLLLISFQRRPSRGDFILCAPFFLIVIASIFFSFIHFGASFSIALTTIHDAARLALRVVWPMPIVAVFIEHPLDSHAWVHI